MSTLIRLVSAQFEAAFTCEAKRKESRPREYVRTSEKQKTTTKMQHTASYSKLWMRFLNEDSFLPKKPFWLFHTRGFCICRLVFFSPSLCFFFFLAGLEWAVLSSLSKTKKNQDLATFEPESGDCCWAVRLFCL